MRYIVMGLIHANTREEVEADSPEEAHEKAACHASLCHQCSDELELGDSYGAIVEDDDGNEVLRVDDRDRSEDEREACAKLVEWRAGRTKDPGAMRALRLAAKAIRARGAK